MKQLCRLASTACVATARPSGPQGRARFFNLGDLATEPIFHFFSHPYAKKKGPDGTGRGQ